jgi:hypothetical protein
MRRRFFKLRLLQWARLVLLAGLIVAWICTRDNPVEVTFIRRYSDRSDRLSGINYEMAWNGAAIHLGSSQWQMQIETDGKPGPIDLARGKPPRTSWYFETHVDPAVLPHVSRLRTETPTSI